MKKSIIWYAETSGPKKQGNQTKVTGTPNFYSSSIPNPKSESESNQEVLSLLSFFLDIGLIFVILLLNGGLVVWRKPRPLPCKVK